MAATNRKRLLIIVISLLFTKPVFAYLDPGTGSLIIQGIIAGLAMAGMAIKIYWHKLVNFIYTIFGKDKPYSSINEEDGEDGEEK